MQNKPKSRADVQWVISSVSLAVTMGLWGVFASQAKKVAGVVGQAALPPQPEQIIVSQPPALLPGQKLLFGGTAPQPQQVIIRTKSRGGGDGGSGGGGGGSASTGSSHP